MFLKLIILNYFRIKWLAGERGRRERERENYKTAKLGPHKTAVPPWN